MEITSLFVWRWCFGEIFTYFGAYIFMSVIFPIKKGYKWKMWVLGYGLMILYLVLLFGGNIDPYAEGIALRLLVTLPIYALIPMFFIEKDGWKYVSFGIGNSFMTSFVIDVCILPYMSRNGMFPYEEDVHIDVSYSVYANKDFTSHFYTWCVSTLIMYLLLTFVYKCLQRNKKIWTPFTYLSMILNVLFFSVLTISGLGVVTLNAVPTLIFSVGNMIAVISCICYGMYKQRKENLLETEVLKMQQQLQEIQAEELLESQTKTRKLRHDLAGHMETLHMLVENGKMDTAKEYAEKVLEEYR